MLGLLTSDLAGGLRRQGRRRASRVTAVAVVAALSLGLAACSSGGGSTTTTIKLNPATATSDVSAAYDNLFHFTTGSVASKEAVIQDGSKLKGAMSQALSSSEASAADGAKIHTVTLLSSKKCGTQSLPYPCAHVVYDILGTSGTAILANNNGYAVYIGGKWLVAKTTICTLLGLFYTAEGKTGSPPGC